MILGGSSQVQREAAFFPVAAVGVKNGSLRSGIFTVVSSNFNLMVNDDARTRD